MQRLKSVLKWGLVLVLLGGLAWMGIGVLRGRDSDTQAASFTQVVTVERGNLVAAITPTGELYASRQAELAFDVNRLPLIELNVTPGQRVQEGEVLARVDPASLERAVAQAEADLLSAEEALARAKRPYTELDQRRAEVAVAQAEVALEEARQRLEELLSPDPTETEKAVRQAGLAVTQAETALEEARQALEDLLNPDIAAAEKAVRDAARELEKARNDLTVVQNDPTAAGRLADLQYQFNVAEFEYVQIMAPADESEILQDKRRLAYNKMMDARDRLEAARTQAALDLLTAKRRAAQAEEALADAQERLARLQAGPDPLEVAKAQNRVAQAEYNLAKAQDDLAQLQAGPDDLTLAQARNQVAQAEYNLAKAQDDLATILAGPDPNEVQLAQARYDAAQAALEDARVALAGATMSAPFEGTVISVGAEVGDLVSSNTVVVTLADLSELRVRAIVDETDISQVEIGQEVEITFDAFPGRRFRGQVLEVPLQGRLVQNIVTYEVPVSLEGAEGVSLKPGMTANLRLVVGRREGVLVVPALAVREGETGPVVMVQDVAEGPGVATRVEVGLSDGLYVEVVRGLNEGDRVVMEYQAPQEGMGGFFGFGRMISGSRPVITRGGSGPVIRRGP